MQRLLASIQIPINSSLYITDPASSNLGNNIITQGVNLINEIGFEKFTFRKLGEVIKSPEASIYRYFSSKQQLLSYLFSLYWGYMECQLTVFTANISSPQIRLQKAIDLIIDRDNHNEIFNGINFQKLLQIIISESSKSYLSKENNKDLNHWVYYNYNQFLNRTSKIILDLNPQYEYSEMLVASIIEGVHLQYFFTEHLPEMDALQNSEEKIRNFYSNLVFQSIK